MPSDIDSAVDPEKEKDPLDPLWEGVDKKALSHNAKRDRRKLRKVQELAAKGALGAGAINLVSAINSDPKVANKDISTSAHSASTAGTKEQQ